MLITLHLDNDGSIQLGPGHLEKTIEVSERVYNEIDYYFNKGEYLRNLLNRLYREAVV